MDGIHHLSLPVSAIPKAVQFYRMVLDAERVGPAEEGVSMEAATTFWVRVGGVPIALVESPETTPDHDAGNGVRPLEDPHVAFAASESELASVRARLDAQRHPYHESTNDIFLRDPDGNLIAVSAGSTP
ncbi:MAG: VOC family protein [Halobacteriaceae archaeon]